MEKMFMYSDKEYKNFIEVVKKDFNQQIEYQYRIFFLITKKVLENGLDEYELQKMNDLIKRIDNLERVKKEISNYL